MFKKRSRTNNVREKVDFATPPPGETSEGGEASGAGEGSGSGGEGSGSGSNLQELLLLRRLQKQARQSAGIDLHRLNRGEEKKVKKKVKKVKEGQEGEGAGSGVDDDESGEEGEGDGYGLRKSGKGKGKAEDGEDDQEDDASKTRRLVRANNFTQQTNALDVDKHMMAYIEEELAKRRGLKSTDPNAPDDPDNDQPYDPQAELYQIAEKYRLEKKQTTEEEEGNVTISMGMLTSIPEVDLGMDVRLKNIEETERAKRSAFDGRRGGSSNKRMSEADESFAAARFYRPNFQIQSDAQALEDAKREVQGLPPIHRGQQKERNEMATDDQVYERFKKRVRKN